MNRQDLHNMDIVFCSEKEMNLECRKEMQGTGVLIDGTTFQFVLNGKRHRNRNRIIYQGNLATARQLKNGNYSIRYVFNPSDDMLTFLEKAQEELDIAGRRVYSDIKERRKQHEV